MSEYSVFSIPDFDANDYANAILAGEAYPDAPKSQQPDPSTKEDISVAISKLTFGIDDVSKQIKLLVTTHHEDFLSQAASANNLDGSLTSVRSGLTDLDTALEKLRIKIRVPYESLQFNVSRLQKFQQASDVLRRTSRFVVLARRLQSQMLEMETSMENPVQSTVLPGMGQDLEDEKERAIAKAALSIAELVSLLHGPKADASSTQDSDSPNVSFTLAPGHDNASRIPLRSVSAVAAHITFVEDAQSKVTDEMQNMVRTGLGTLNQSLLASSLQTAYNLQVLPELVQELILDLSKVVEDRIKNTFDLATIAQNASAKDVAPTPQSPTQYKSRYRTEPTNVTAPQWTLALWSGIETMVEDMANCCIKVYTLERVLKMKKDTVSQVVFLDEAMKLLENKPSVTFWASLGRSLEKASKDSSRGSTFIQQTLSTGYPKLLRLFHEFFAKIAVHTDTVYVHSFQSPETVLILRAISNFESLYLSRSSTKLNEAVSQALSGGARSPPSANSGVDIARAISNEIDSARFDPLLVLSVTKNAMLTLELMLSKIDALVVKDRSTVALIGPTATPNQVLNASLASCLYHTWSKLSNLEEEHSATTVKLIKPSIEKVRLAYTGLVDPLLTSIRRELGAILARLHRIDFSRYQDAMAGGGSSLYLKDLSEKMTFIKDEILSRYHVGDEYRTWVVSIVQFVIRTFVLHVSIAKPLGESGKLQLTTDMAELEFALNGFMAEGPNKRGGNLETLVGDDYRVLRAMRRLLFLENSQLKSPQHTVDLPPLIVLHHILVRSPVSLPHSLHGWQEAEYVRWVEEHTEDEAWSLVDSGLSHWEKISESDVHDGAVAREYVDLARAVLKNSLS